MADAEKIKISELAGSSSYAGAFVPGVDSEGETKKFALAPLVNVIESIKVNGTAQTISDKSVDISIESIEYVPASSLPAASASTMNKIYLIPASDGSATRDQWVTVRDGGTYSWQKIGTTDINLSNCTFLGTVVESNVTMA